MSLGVGRLAGATAGAVLFIWSEPVRFGWNRKIARKLLKFGLPLAGSSIVVFSVKYVDQFVVGSVIGPVALGFYVLAFNLSSWPIAVFSQPVREVSPAAFARLQHDPSALRSAFIVSLGLLTAVTLPVCLVLTGAADPLIAMVYGLAWTPSAAALGWLGVLAGVRIVFELVYDYFVVLGSTRVVFTVQLVWLDRARPRAVRGRAPRRDRGRRRRARLRRAVRGAAAVPGRAAPGGDRLAPARRGRRGAAVCAAAPSPWWRSPRPASSPSTRWPSPSRAPRHWSRWPSRHAGCAPRSTSSRRSSPAGPADRSQARKNAGPPALIVRGPAPVGPGRKREPWNLSPSSASSGASGSRSSSSASSPCSSATGSRTGSASRRSRAATRSASRARGSSSTPRTRRSSRSPRRAPRRSGRAPTCSRT